MDLSLPIKAEDLKKVGDNCDSYNAILLSLGIENRRARFELSLNDSPRL